MSDTNTRSSNTEALHAAVELLEKLGDVGSLSSQERLERIYNMIMKAERQLHLSNNGEESANGYYSRELGTTSGNLSLSVPRTREGTFRPQILPDKFQRDSEERSQLLDALFANSYSPNNMKRVLRDLGLHYSDTEINKLRDFYIREYDAWMARSLESDWVSIFIDAYHTDLQENGKVKKAAAYSVLGINFNSVKQLLGVYISFGSETKAFWLTVLNDLVNRGLKRVILVVSDQFPGITEAVNALFPKAHHQLCFIHMQRNVQRNMSRDHASELNQELSNLRTLKSFDDAKQTFLDALAPYKKTYPHFISNLEAHVNNYLAFMHFDKSIRKYFYTTNAVESVNSDFERLRLTKGGFFQSTNCLKVNLYLVYKRLAIKWKNGMPQIKANLYCLLQAFALAYGEQPCLPQTPNKKFRP